MHCCSFLPVLPYGLGWLQRCSAEHENLLRWQEAKIFELDETNENQYERIEKHMKQFKGYKAHNTKLKDENSRQSAELLGMQNEMSVSIDSNRHLQQQRSRGRDGLHVICLDLHDLAEGKTSIQAWGTIWPQCREERRSEGSI